MQVPYDLRYEGVRNAISTFKTCIKKYRKDKKMFELHEKDMTNKRRNKMAVFRPNMIKCNNAGIFLNSLVYKKYTKNNNITDELPDLNLYECDRKWLCETFCRLYRLCKFYRY